MNKELLMVFIPGVSWILFALGGTQISDKIPGKKWIRRFVLPIFYFLSCALVVQWWQALICGVLACITFHLGYGDSSNWLKRILVASMYGVIGLAIGISFWNIAAVLGFLVLYLLSNTKLTAQTFVWKICEGFFGLLVGIEIAYSLMGLPLQWLQTPGWLW